MNRIGTAPRKTAEVDINVEIRLDQPICEISFSAEEEEPDIKVSLGDHFFAQLHRFSGFGGEITASGDLPHHVLEDVGICWGRAFKEALGDRAGILRTSSHIMPMEGTVVTVAVDISGRPHAVVDFQIWNNNPMAEMVKHVLIAMATHGAFDLYVKVETVGKHSVRLVHHDLETVGKALGRVLHDAVKIEGEDILSTKETLTA